MAGGDRRKADSALIAALAGGQTVQAAAKSAGISERTAYRRLEDADFRRQVQAARAELVARAVGLLADASGEAVMTLRALLAAQAETVRLGAARAVLELGAKLREAGELEARLAALEAAARQPPRRIA